MTPAWGVGAKLLPVEGVVPHSACPEQATPSWWARSGRTGHWFERPQLGDARRRGLCSLAEQPASLRVATENHRSWFRCSSSRPSIEQFFDEQFCLLALFIPDSFVREVVRDFADELDPNPGTVDQRAPAIDVKEESFLTAYFESMRPYLSLDGAPPTPLLRLKLKELITGVLVSEVNRPLAAYLQSQSGHSAPSLSDIMETNFRYGFLQ